MKARAVSVAVGVAVALGLTGCAGGPSTAPSPRTPAIAQPTTPPPASPAPTPGTCHRLAFAAASRPTGGGTVTDCSHAHTAVTYYVGLTRPVVDGHLMAVDSQQVQSQLARSCPSRLAAYLGGTPDDLRLSRFTAVWFGPTVTQADRGARWYRCDVVALASGNTLAALPRSMHGALGRAAIRNRYGTCGTTAPSARGFQKVICSLTHTWRAVSVVPLSAHTRYLGKAATSAGDSACKSVASARANGALRYTWSFQWPSRQRWDAGDRTGLCWVPDRR